jgi:hypothetical protein
MFHVWFTVLTVVIRESSIFWGITPCRPFGVRWKLTFDELHGVIYQKLELLNMFSTCYRTLSFITAFIRARCKSRSSNPIWLIKHGVAWSDYWNMIFEGSKHQPTSSYCCVRTTFFCSLPDDLCSFHSPALWVTLRSCHRLHYIALNNRITGVW